jgi:YidC/Oxa1 family membrane protein insertase
VFAGLFVLLAGVAVLAVRAARRVNPAVPAVPVTPARGIAPPASAPPASAPGASAPGGRAVSLMTWVVPFASVVTAAIVPLAAGLYLLTTTAWTLAERTVLRRRFISATQPQPASVRPGEPGVAPAPPPAPPAR